MRFRFRGVYRYGFRVLLGMDSAERRKMNEVNKIKIRSNQFIIDEAALTEKEDEQARLIIRLCDALDYACRQLSGSRGAIEEIERKLEGKDG